MTDEEARFAFKLARLMNRVGDWWNIKGEHTPYEWAMQQAMFLVEPYGEDRADLRAAHNTIAMCLAQASAMPSEEVIAEVENALRFYLQCNQPEEEVHGPGITRKLMEG